MRIVVLYQCICQAMPSLPASPTNEPQDNFDDTSLFMSMKAAIAESRIHGVDYDLFAINPLGQFPCPQDVEEFRRVVSALLFQKFPSHPCVRGC